MVHQAFGAGARCFGEGCQHLHPPLEQADDRPGRIGAAVQHPLAQLQQTHLQLHGKRRIRGGDRPPDRLLLRLQILDQGLALG